MKYCPKCKESKVLDCFNKNKRNKDGLAGYCRKCESAIYMARRDAALRKKRETSLLIAESDKEIPDRKHCNKCSRTLASDQFTKFRYSRDGLRCTCKDCDKKHRAKTYDRRKITRAKNREENKERVNALARKSYRKRVSEDHCVRIKYAVSKAVRCGLKRAGSSKHGESTFKHLPYTAEELKSHLESQWQSWMGWNNYGKYDAERKTWQIDHIIPQSALPFSSFSDENFHKLWALENLRPLETVANIKKGASSCVQDC